MPDEIDVMDWSDIIWIRDNVTIIQLIDADTDYL